MNSNPSVSAGHSSDGFASPPDRLAVSVDEGFASWMSAFDGSLAITTYQAGKMVLVGWDGRQVTILPRHFDKPMGLSVNWPCVALTTRTEVTLFADANLLAADYVEREPGKYDALILPRATYWTGDLNTHDLGHADDGLWLVATRLGCLARLSGQFNCLPVWKPLFVTEIAPEDRCHLNGLCMVDGKPKYVTCLGETNTAGGWRENKAKGGVVLDVETGTTLLRGLAMPHSPRWHNHKLWVLNSGAGELLIVDPKNGHADVVARLPGYLRGLAFVGAVALVGLCQIRERHIFGDLPIQQTHTALSCGVTLVDLSTGSAIGKLEFTSGATEIFDVQVMPQVRRPTILNLTADACRHALSAPEFAYWLRPSNLVRN